MRRPKHGTVFKGATNGTGRSFSFNGLNGSGPMAGVVIDPRNGNLYGTTEGTPSAFGNVFELGAKGKLTVLYSFCSELNCIDGKAPWAGLLGDATGNIYGTTTEGGANGLGVVFEITP